MHGIEFKDPWYLALLVLLVPLIYLWLRRIQMGRFSFSSTESIARGSQSSWRLKTRYILLILRALAFVLLVVALARPRQGLPETEIEQEGIDIVLILDRSSSMLAQDFLQNNRPVTRMEVVKDVVQDFVAKREHDRIGVVLFARYAVTHAPLTTDNEWLMHSLKDVQTVRPNSEQDGTAIGDAIGTAINRFKYSKAKSKIAVLLTDGANNVETWLSPANAAQIASDQEIKIYTIGVGAEARAFGRIVASLDEEVLKKIADMTGAAYYRATDVQSLSQIYNTIDKLERSQIVDKRFEQYQEMAHYPLGLAFVLIFLEIVLARTVYRILP